MSSLDFKRITEGNYDPNNRNLLV